MSQPQSSSSTTPVVPRPPRRRGPRSWSAVFLGTVVTIYLIWSLVPVVVAVAFSFNAGYSRSVWQGFSTQWWTGSSSVFHVSLYSDALRQSFLLAVLAVAITVPLGVSLAVFISRWHGVGLRPVSLFSTLPLVVPELVLAIALFMLVTRLLPVVQLGTPAQVIGQVTFALPLVIVVTRGRLASIPLTYEEAALDLGAPPLAAFRLVLIPLLQPAVVASVIVTFAISIDDFVITQYMSGAASTQTVPMLIYNTGRGSATPALNATASVMAFTTMATVGLGYLLYRVATRRGRIVEPADASMLDLESV